MPTPIVEAVLKEVDIALSEIRNARLLVAFSRFEIAQEARAAFLSARDGASSAGLIATVVLPDGSWPRITFASWAEGGLRGVKYDRAILAFGPDHKTPKIAIMDDIIHALRESPVAPADQVRWVDDR